MRKRGGSQLDSSNLLRSESTVLSDLWERCEARTRFAVGGSAFVVDDIGDLAIIPKAHGDHVVEADVGVCGNFDGAGEHDVRGGGRRCRCRDPRLRGW